MRGALFCCCGPPPPSQRLSSDSRRKPNPRRLRRTAKGRNPLRPAKVGLRCSTSAPSGRTPTAPSSSRRWRSPGARRMLPGFDVVGRSEIFRAMLGFEKQRQAVGCTEDASCLAEIGGALGVDYILIGSLGQTLGALARLDLKLVETRKARVRNRIGVSLQGQQEKLVATTQRAIPISSPIAPSISPAKPPMVANLPTATATAVEAAAGTPSRRTWAYSDGRRRARPPRRRRGRGPPGQVRRSTTRRAPSTSRSTTTPARRPRRWPT